MTTPNPVPYAEMANSIYTGRLPDGLGPFPFYCDLEDAGFVCGHYDQWVHTDSGLVIRAAEVDEQKVLVFGGTTSGLSVGENWQARSKTDLVLHAKQWITNLTVGAGVVSDNLEQAVEVTRRVLAITPNIVLVGHSKGAAEAAYVALKLDLPALTFCSPGLSVRVLETLERQNSERIHHWRITGDPVSELTNFVPWLVPVGQQHAVPNNSDLSGVDSHIAFTALIKSHFAQ